MSSHANARAQQRGIPPLIDQMLDMYGEEQYDGHGGVLVFLSVGEQIGYFINRSGYFRQFTEQRFWISTSVHVTSSECADNDDQW